ncbi:unnamed protein product [Pararhodospirillum photometricum DSM 122]|uniref:Uncharacterized protein n=1 Tax=Pararhodospirillum photometricum DSM 122 TaxID=1150469 RepID=H6SN39_PARPM|nr:unnamed protein product [Pararhodospirillum photometricum DSM 122]
MNLIILRLASLEVLLVKWLELVVSVNILLFILEMEKVVYIGVIW